MADEELRVRGEAQVQGQDYARARQEAILDAMRAGVVQVAKSFFDDGRFVRIQDLIEGRLEEKARRLVKDYRLLEESRVEDRVQVDLLLVPWRIHVRQELIDGGIVYDHARKPRFYLTWPEGRESSQWNDTLRLRLQDLGFFVTSNREEADVWVMAELGSMGRAFLPIHFEAEMRTPLRRFSRRTVQIRLEWSEAKGAGVLATAILERVLPTWIQSVGGGRVVEIEVIGAVNNHPLMELRKIFNSNEWGFSEGRDVMYAPGKVVFQTVFDGEVGKLVSTLGRVKIGEDRLVVVGVKDRRVQVQIGQP